MVKITAQTDGGDTLSGLGEIRASKSRTGEGQNEAFEFASRLATAIRGADLDVGARGRSASRAAEAFVSRHVKELCGVSPDRRLPRSVHPAVRFGFDCAILDLISRENGDSVLGTLGGSPTGVRLLNVVNCDFAKSAALLEALYQPSTQPVWLRGRFSRIGAATKDVFAAVDAASSEMNGARAGIWFVVAGAWSAHDLAAMTRELRRFAPSGVAVVLEQPFAHFADAYYESAFEVIRASSLPIRIMVEDGLHAGAECGDSRIDDYLPSSDLRVTAQAFSGVEKILDRLDVAQAAGFEGSVYFGNTGRNTAFSTVVLATLAQLAPRVRYFSARPVVRRSFRQVQPQTEVTIADEPNGAVEVVTSPSGEGWGVSLCRSILSSRLVRAEFFRDWHVTRSDHNMLLEELILDSFDDLS